MLFYIIILSCSVLSFCQERPYQNVPQLRYRIKRVPEKDLEELHQLLQNNSNNHQTHKAKISSAHPKLQPVHPNIISRQKRPNSIVINKVSVAPRSPLQKNIDLKNNIAKTASIPNKNKDALESTTSIKETAQSSHDIITEPKPFIEDPSDDIKLIVKPQSTAQNEQTNSQLKTPIVNNQDDTIDKHNKPAIEENKRILLKNTLHKTLILSDEKSENHDDKETNQMSHRKNHHKSDADNEKNDGVQLSTIVSNDTQVQIEKPVADITKRSDNSSTLNNKIYEDVIENRRESDQNNVEQQTENEEENKKEELNITNNTRRLLLPFVGKELKIVPISSPKKNDRIPNKPRNTITSEPKLRIDDNSKKNDNNSSISKPLIDCATNDTFDVIEIKQRNITEVIERRHPSIESKEYFYLTPSWQPYGPETSNIEYEDIYKPRITYLPPYKYTNSNPYGNGCRYSNPTFDKSHKTWRSWVDTDIFIKKNKIPYDKYTRNVLFNEIPSRKERKINENNFGQNAKPIIFTSYPSYVYPNTDYAPTLLQ